MPAQPLALNPNQGQDLLAMPNRYEGSSMPKLTYTLDKPIENSDFNQNANLTFEDQGLYAKTP